MRTELIFLILISFRFTYSIDFSKHYSFGNWTISKNLTKWYLPWELCVLDSKVNNETNDRIKERCFDSYGLPADGKTTFKCRYKIFNN